MKSFCKELLSAHGRVSSVRLMSMACVITACLIGVYGVIKDVDLGGISELVAVFLSAGFSGKVAQKYIEGKKSSDEVSK